MKTFDEGFGLFWHCHTPFRFRFSFSAIKTMFSVYLLFILTPPNSFYVDSRFSGRLWPDWGNTARAATARLGSIGLI